MLNMELPGRREERISQRKFVDIVKDNMQRAGVTETDDMNRVRLS